jgi:S-adenosylmethionine:tRNA ribosyltransferase-isomerase
MTIQEKIDIENYHYTLPDDAIARYPLADRNTSNMLLYKQGQISLHQFHTLPSLIPPGSMLVFNNTRVLQARLEFRKTSGAKIEIFCLEPRDPAEIQLALECSFKCSWLCLVGNAKKWKKGAVYLMAEMEGKELKVEAIQKGREGDSYIIEFNWSNADFSFGEIIEHLGSTPIPPYLGRKAEDSDKHQYQTVYSLSDGSVAAPTAGLHFTRPMIRELSSQGIAKGELTLHVGAGTFVPVKTDNARSHSMHAEQVIISVEFLEQWRKHRGKLIAVGTTSTRSLETIYWLGVKLHLGQFFDPDQIHFEQWENEKLPGDIELRESLEALLSYCSFQKIKQFRFATSLMIVPGYRFRTIDGLITNFHLPGSTLLLLIAALIGDDWKKVYETALSKKFRFLSYGDSSLLLPGK